MNNTIIFSGASKQYINHLKFIIYSFEVACGLTINFLKSTLIGISLNQSKTSTFSSILVCSQSSLPMSYLGFPLHYNKPWRSDWVFLKQKIERKLKAWKGSLLSLAGRLALVNAVLGAIPIYWMSKFEIPIATIQWIDSFRRRFL